MYLRYNMRIEKTTVLGFGKRCVIWVQGCDKNPPCKGCIAVDMQPINGGTIISVDEMASWVCSLDGINGMTISGGEPFLQAKAVYELVKKIKANKSSNFSVIIYSGNTYEEMVEDEEYKNLLSITDILIDGRYIEEFNDSVPYRGSSNQRIIVLNDYFKEDAKLYYTDKKGRHIEYVLSGDKVMLIGVPSISQAETWKNIKRNN